MERGFGTLDENFVNSAFFIDVHSFSKYFVKIVGVLHSSHVRRLYVSEILEIYFSYSYVVLKLF